tara:strand:+ start:43 stop:315 length:273 start_codon:yes stop_codon:yes gene_type:complete
MSLLDIFSNKQKSIVREINEYLEESTWSDYEVKHGKTIYVFDDWYDHIKPIIKEYKLAGWIVSRNVELNSMTPGYPRHYLIFKHPLFSSN